MTTKRARYSLRSQCRDHGSCSCVNSPDLPSVKRRKLRKDEKLNFSSNTTGYGSDGALSFADVGSSSELDESFSPHSCNTSISIVANKKCSRRVTFNKILEFDSNATGILDSSLSNIFHKIQNNGDSSSRKGLVISSTPIQNQDLNANLVCDWSPIESETMSSNTRSRNVTMKKVVASQNSTSKTSTKIFGTDEQHRQLTYERSEVLLNGKSFHQQEQFQSVNSMMNSSILTRGSRGSVYTPGEISGQGMMTRTRSGSRTSSITGAAGGLDDPDEFNIHRRTDSEQRYLRESSVDSRRSVISTTVKQTKGGKRLAPGMEDTFEQEEDPQMSLWQKAFKGFKSFFFHLYLVIAHCFTFEKWLLQLENNFKKFKTTVLSFFRSNRNMETVEKSSSRREFVKYHNNGLSDTPTNASIAYNSNGNGSNLFTEGISNEKKTSGNVFIIARGRIGSKLKELFIRKRQDSIEDMRNLHNGIVLDDKTEDTCHQSRNPLTSSTYYPNQIQDFERGSSVTKRSKKVVDNYYTDDENEEDDNNMDETRKSSVKFGAWDLFTRFLILLSIFVVITALLFLVYSMWPVIISFATFACGLLSNLFNGTTSALSSIISQVSIRISRVDPGDEVKEVPSMNKWVLMGFPIDNSHSNSPQISMTDIDEIIKKLMRLENTLESHEKRLSNYETMIFEHRQLRKQIVELEDAKKAFSVQGKTSEQIFIEMMDFELGETAEGELVTLKTLVIDYINQDLVKHNLTEFSRKLNSLKKKYEESQTNVLKELSVLKQTQMIQENSMAKLAEQKPEHIEVDIEGIKKDIIPELLKEIESQVKISCTTRNCPESEVTPSSVVLNGPSTEDVEKLIKLALAKYDADKTGMADLALEPAGGSILSTRCTKSSKLRNSVVSLWGFKIWSPPNNPRTIIQPGVVPGECWAFEGSIGDVVIKLVSPSIVTGFTMEHISKSVSPYGSIDSAPYMFQVWGLNEENDFDTAHNYGTFKYEDNDETLQHFSASNVTETPYPIVELKVLSNHGNILHTCLYRFRVHGSLALGGSHFTATVQSEQSEG